MTHLVVVRGRLEKRIIRPLFPGKFRWDEDLKSMNQDLVDCQL